MAKSKPQTLAFKKKNCGHCGFTDQRALRKGWPWCGYTIKEGEDPDIRNGHCKEMKPTGKKARG